LPLATVFDSLEVLGAHLGPAIRDGHLAFDASVRGHVNDVATLAEAWRLTPTEARVALCLGEGRSPTQVAQALEMAVGTVRVHLKSVYSKTDTSGQRELVSRLNTWRLP
jgi:DNA-binding CsgD family transcriptional regulator